MIGEIKKMLKKRLEEDLDFEGTFEFDGKTVYHFIGKGRSCERISVYCCIKEKTSPKIQLEIINYLEESKLFGRTA